MNQDLETFRNVGYSEVQFLAKCSKAGLTVWVVETGLCALMPQLIFLLGVLKDDPFSRSQFINLSSSTSQRRLPKRMIAP